MYKPTHFQLHELVSRVDYERYGTKCWELFDERLLVTLDTLRELVDAPITVNTWRNSGAFNWRGLRTAAYYGNAQKYADSRSQHKYGRAVDCDIKGHTAEQARQFIYQNKAKLPHISFVEDGVNWLHFDLRNCPAITVWHPDTSAKRIV